MVEPSKWSCLLFPFLSLIEFRFVETSLRYYSTYTSYGSGDTIIQPFLQHAGSLLPNHKWNIECLDGEAMIGISDLQDDFARIQQLWCKFTFANKPPSNGLYPYYSGCHVRNFTDQWHCFDPLNAERTINTFVTAISANNFWFWNYRVPQDDQQFYKCCRPPTGYYIDYMSCYYMPTHDQLFEYYDHLNMFIVYCAQDYVMTGIAKKINPYNKERHMEWIQCCRMGFGPHEAHPPPVTLAPSGAMSYHSSRADTTMSSVPVSRAYQEQYRRKTNGSLDVSMAAKNTRFSVDNLYTEATLSGGRDAANFLKIS